MFSVKSNLNEDEALKTVIDKALIELLDYSVMDDEYDQIIKKLQKLYELRTPKKERKPVDPNTLLTVLANLAGIGLILNYERLNVVTSKALSFVKKI